jgi:hypothetical protein
LAKHRPKINRMRHAGGPSTANQHTGVVRSLVAIESRNTNYELSFAFPFLSRQNLAPRPVPTGQAHEVVQNAPKISSGDQL